MAYCVEIIIIIIIITLVSIFTMNWCICSIMVEYQTWFVGIINIVKINKSINSQSMIPLGYQ